MSLQSCNDFSNCFLDIATRRADTGKYFSATAIRLKDLTNLFPFAAQAISMTAVSEVDTKKERILTDAPSKTLNYERNFLT